MLIYSILFFTLGVALTGFLIALLSPLIWRRLLFLARKTIKAETPFSLKEVEMKHNFLKAQHAVELAHAQERYNLLEKFSDEQKIKLDTNAEQLRKLNHLENKTAQMREEIAYYKNKLESEHERLNAIREEQQKNAEEVGHCLTNERIIRMANERIIRMDIARYEEKMTALKTRIDELAQQLPNPQQEETQRMKAVQALRQDLKEFTAQIIQDFKSQSSPSVITVGAHDGQKKITTHRGKLPPPSNSSL